MPHLSASKLSQRFLHALLLFAIYFSFTVCTHAAQVILQNGLNGYTGTEDTSLYSDRPLNSNGGGFHFFTGINAQGDTRRTLLRFDLTGALPPGAEIISVQLRLTVDRSRELSTTHTLHRMLRAWGEGSVDAGEPGGFGADAQPGDATWTTAELGTTTWTTPGGDFVTSASAARVMGNVGSSRVFSSGLMADDVRFWLAHPAQNYGWMLRGWEVGVQNAKRFISSENANDSSPELTINYQIILNPARRWTFYD